jgi:Biotin-requiring enzyme
MPARASTKVFVPSTRQIPGTPGTVVACHKRRGEQVEAEEALFEIRFADVDAEVLAPLAGTLVGLHVATGDTVSVGWPLADIASYADGKASLPTGSFASSLIARAPLVIAVAVGAPALIWPFWLVVVIIGSLLLVGIERTWVPARRLEPADVFTLPLGVVAGAGGWIRGRLSQPAPLAETVRFAGWLVVAIVGTAAVGGALWLASDGTNGLVAAMRLADFGYALRVFAFLASISLIRRGLSVAARKAYLVRMLSGVPAAALAGATLVALVWALLCAVVLPRDAWWPAPNLHEAVSSMPVGLRNTVHEWERSLAETEARAVVNCAAERGRGGWLPPTGLLRADGTVAVSVNFDRASPPDDRSLAVLMLALQNQLAPNVSIVIMHTGKPRARIRYELIPTTRPITEIDLLADRVTLGLHTKAHLAAVRSISEPDINVALRCSAVAF